jgi:hypothetical protein
MLPQLSKIQLKIRIINCNSVLLGLSEALDCIERITLKDKLYQYGVRCMPHKLLKLYLTSRT